MNYQNEYPNINSPEIMELLDDFLIDDDPLGSENSQPTVNIMESSWAQTEQYSQQFCVPTPASYSDSPFLQTSYNPPSNNSYFDDICSIPTPTPPTPNINTLNIKPEAPPPPTTDVQTSTQLINRMIQLQTEQEQQLKKMREQQKQLFQNPSVELYQQLSNEQKEIKEKLDYELKSVNVLLTQTLLQPGELHRVDYLKTEFNLQLKQLELYYYEIEQLRLQRRATKPIASLVFIKQPFPAVHSKHTSLTEDQLVLQLFTGAAVEIESFSPVKATLICESHQSKPTDAKMIDGDVQQLDKHSLTVSFPINFREGTRKNAVYLRFIMDVKVSQAGQSVSGTVESENSAPFVVMTNQKQWEACERTLLLRDSFNGQLEVPWPLFANALQRQFIRATRQDPSNPTRCLSRFDFGYLHEKFLLKRKSLHQKEYDNFWNWYGKCIQVIRYQRHIGFLWQGGLIYGLMTREEVDMALTGEPPGTFIMRFSERHAGQFGIAYVCSDTKVKHYLVQPNDTAAAKFTLPDFLRDKPQLTEILQFTILPNNRPHFKRLLKDVALEQYYSRRVGGDTSGSGYDPLTGV